jgi:hypothetical protein
MKAFNLVLGLPRQETQKSTAATVDMTALQAPNGPQRAKIPETDWTCLLPERGEENTNDEPPLCFQLLEANAFDHL